MNDRAYLGQPKQIQSKHSIERVIEKVLNLIYNRLWAELYLFRDTYKHDEDDEVWSRD